METELLAKGLNFSITSKTLSNKDIIATVEDAVKDLEKEEVDTICAKVSLTLQSSKPPNDNLSKDERKALKEVQSDNQLQFYYLTKVNLQLSLTERTIWKKV